MALKSLASLMIFALFLSVSTARNTLSPYASPSGEDDDDALPPMNAEVPTPELGFFPIDTKNPIVTQLAQSAVEDYNKEHNLGLVYSGVSEAIATADEQGKYFNLVVEAKEKGVLNHYSVVVLHDNVSKLVQFEKINDDDV